MTEDNEKDAASSPMAVSGPSSLPSDHEETEPPVVAFKTWIVALVILYIPSFAPRRNSND